MAKGKGRKGENTKESKPSQTADFLVNKTLTDACVLFLAAFVLMFYFRSAGLWHTDSVLEAEAAEITFHTGRLHYLMGLGYPGEAVLQTVMFAVFHVLFGMPNAEFSATFTSILFGALGVGMIYLLAKKISGSRMVGIYSAAVLCVLPVYLSLSTYAKNQTPESFFMMTAVYAAILAAEKRAWQHKVLAGLLLGWTMGLRQTSGLILPVMLLFYWRGSPPVKFVKQKDVVKMRITQKPLEFILDLAYFIIPAFAVFVGLFVPQMIYTPGYSLIESIKYFSQEASTGYGLNPFTPLLAMSFTWATTSMTYLGWILLAVGVYAMYQGRDSYLTSILMAWFLLFFFVLSNTAMVSPRFLIPAFIPALMLIGYALDYISSKVHAYASYAILLALMYLMFTTILPVLEYRHAHCGPCEFARKISETVPPDAVVIGMDEGPHYRYYGNITRATYGAPSNGDDKMLEMIIGVYGQFLANGTPMYVTTQGMGYDPSAGLQYNQQTQRITYPARNIEYRNLQYDPQKQLFYDTRYGITLPGPPYVGKFWVTVFNKFRVTPILQMEDEDWHHSDLELAKYGAILYKIELGANSTV